MSKQLHLLRHAKSSWSDAASSDRQRGLNKRGRRDAPRMGQALSELLAAQVIAASPARRAQATLEGLIEGWPALGELNHRREEDLYTFSAGELRDWIAGQADEASSLFLLGHNPALTDLANWLCGETVLMNLPTAGYVGMELACEHWSELRSGCAHVRHTLFPREIPD
jgi:phosphohistidine phosphatase